MCEESSGPFCTDGPPDQDIIQLHISCPSDKEEEKSSKDEYENEEKNKDKTPRKMLSRGKPAFLGGKNGCPYNEYQFRT